MKIALILELDPREEQQVLQNSIERVMNNAITVGQSIGVKSKIFEEASILWQDCEELKPLVSKIWGAVRNAIFEQRVILERTQKASRP